MSRTQKRKTGANIIATLLGWDISEVTEGRYQDTANPTIYVCGNDYFVCPTSIQKLPKGYEWTEVDIMFGRMVYKAKGSE